jgi:hypothetical protein
MLVAFRWIMLTLLTISTNSYAALEDYTYYDLLKCIRGSVSGDFSDSEVYKPEHPIQVKAKGRSVLESPEGCYGFCTFKSDTTQFECHKDSCSQFPLAGATYWRISKDSGEMPTYKCIKGCKHAPKYVLDIDRTEDATPDIWEKRVEKEFKKACGAR